MTDNHDNDDRSAETLSPEGRRRRQTILGAALKAARRRRVRRYGLRATAACGIVAFVVIATLTFRPKGGSGPAAPYIVERPAPQPVRTDRSATTSSPSQPPAPPTYVIRPRQVTVTIAPIKTDRTLADQWAVRPAATGDGIPRVDDATLIKALGSAGLSGGVIVRQGRPELWWQPTVLRDSRPMAKGGGI